MVTTQFAVCACGACFAASRFTGKERDAESGNDYMDARYYGSSMARFLTPDPSGIASVDPTNPQSWNLYSYALNNPLVLTDPTGLDPDPCNPPVDASPGPGGESGGVGDDPAPCMTPPPMPPDEPCTGSGCDPDPVQDANDMALIVSILDPGCVASA